MTRKRMMGMLASVLIAALCAGILQLELLHRPDSALADALYQRPKTANSDIMLISIDQKSLDELGPFVSWGRALMGDVIEILNEQPEYQPAVIGIDVLYVGESDDPDGDAYLAAMAGSGCPVVVACAGTFGSELVDGADGEFYMDHQALIAFDEPYESLKQNTDMGHINSMFDADGILRHGIWQIDLPDGTPVKSFHRQIYENYCAAKGIEASTVPQVDANGNYYIPFQSKPGGFSDGYGVIDLLRGEIPPEEYAGKIVLIGPYAAGMQDDFTTAIDHASKMYGIEYQANMIAALLAAETKKEAAAWPQALILFIVLLAMLILLQNCKISHATFAWMLCVAAWLLACLISYKIGIVLRPLYLPLFVTIGYIVIVAYNYVLAALEKRKITSTFERYVAPEIVSELLKEGSDAVKLGGKNYDIAVLFVDIRGFTSMSEVLEPEQVVEILNRYLTLTSSCIFKNNGTLDKFVGDCTMAFWGAPLPQEDCIYKAVKTAFDMVESAEELKKELLEKYNRTVDFGIGVHFGPAVVGNIGAKNRMDYTAIGDTVNTASRLESNAPAGTIYVSRVVADALEGSVRFESLGDAIKLKGKTEGFEVIRAVELL